MGAMGKTTGTPEHTAKCLACGRVRRFRSAAALLAAGPDGRTCAAKLRIVRAAARVALAEVFTPEQLDKADEIFEDGALVPTGIDGLFLTVSSDGSEYYTTTTYECSCPASKPCCHNAAATMALAA
jgi:hypothetical protein